MDSKKEQEKSEVLHSTDYLLDFSICPFTSSYTCCFNLCIGLLEKGVWEVISLRIPSPFFPHKGAIGFEHSNRDRGKRVDYYF